MPCKRIFDALRPAILRGCVCLLVLAPTSLPAEALKKAVADEFIRFLRKAVRPEEENVARRAGKTLSPEAERSIKVSEAIHKLETRPSEEEALAILWSFADKATKERVQLQASALKRNFREEAERLKKEKELPDECGEALASAFIKTGCFVARERIKTGSWPTEEANDRFAAGLGSGAVQCLFPGLAHHISQVASAEVARIAVPVTKGVGKVIGKASGAQETSKSEEPDKIGLAGLVLEMCKHE